VTFKWLKHLTFDFLLPPQLNTLYAQHSFSLLMITTMLTLFILLANPIWPDLKNKNTEQKLYTNKTHIFLYSVHNNQTWHLILKPKKAMAITPNGNSHSPKNTKATNLFPVAQHLHLHAVVFFLFAVFVHPTREQSAPQLKLMSWCR
jgi:hypothetical protein